MGRVHVHVHLVCLTAWSLLCVLLRSWCCVDVVVAVVVVRGWVGLGVQKMGREGRGGRDMMGAGGDDGYGKREKEHGGLTCIFVMVDWVVSEFIKDDEEKLK